MKNYNYVDQLLEALKQADPYRIILFGSYARGTAGENSDIDMLVILDNNDVAKTYEERLKKKMKLKIQDGYYIKKQVEVWIGFAEKDMRIASSKNLTERIDASR